MDDLRATTPGDEVQRLLREWGDNPDVVRIHIKADPQHWCSMALMAVPWFAISRCQQAALAWISDG